MRSSRKTFLGAATSALFLPALIAGATPASAARDAGATVFPEVSITGNSPVCFGTLAAEVRPMNYGADGGVAARFDFTAAIRFVPRCAVPTTIFWRNLDTGNSGALAHDIVPVDPLSANTSHGAGGDYVYFTTGPGRIVLQLSTNPGELEITVS